jgi:hypothetical protein
MPAIIRLGFHRFRPALQAHFAGSAIDVWAEIAYDQAGIADAVAKAWSGGVKAVSD